MTQNKDSKQENHTAQDQTTNQLSDKDVASVSGGAVPNPSFAIKNKNHIAHGKTTNELSEQELASVSGGGLVTDVLETTKNLVVDVTKTATDVVKKLV